MTTPTQAEIVIIGGGIIGCCIAYHLTRMGHRDVLILEKSGVTHGATWHAAGLVGQLRTSRNVTRMLQRSVELYDRLEQETGQAIDWKKVGSLRLACSPERLLEVKRAATMAKSFGLEMEHHRRQGSPGAVPADEHRGRAGRRLPAQRRLCRSGERGPGAGQGRAHGRGQDHRGRPGHRASRSRAGAPRGCGPSRAIIACEILVNAAGMWGREIGQMAGMRVPSLAIEHQYLVTDPIPDMPKNMPTLRDPDLLVYYKPEVRGIAVGGYEPDTLPFGERGIPREFARELLPGNFDRFEQLADARRQAHADPGEGGRAPAHQRAHPLFRRFRFHHGQVAGARQLLRRRRFPLRHRRRAAGPGG